MHSEKSKLMCVWLLLFLIGGISALLVGCSRSETYTSKSGVSLTEDDFNLNDDRIQADEQPSEEHDRPNTNNEQDPDAAGREIVTLLVHGRQKENEAAENRNDTYALSNSDSDMIIDLFYNHEKESLESPLDCAATIEFRIGNDYLTTSLGDIGTLSGRIDGRLVIVLLNENERDLLHQLVCMYAQDIPG